MHNAEVIRSWKKNSAVSSRRTFGIFNAMVGNVMRNAVAVGRSI